MTKLQEIQIRLSECRQRLNELLGMETRTDEQTTEMETLTTEVSAKEPELRAAIAAEPDAERLAREAAAAGGAVDAETRERLELRGRSTVGAFLAAALAGRLPGGAEAEYGAACGAKPGHIPFDLWEQDRPRPDPETRAVTPAPTTGTGVTVAPVQPFVFAPSIAPRLGIDMPSVESGGYSEMTIATSLPAAAKAKGGDADDTAGALTPLTANPRRISARMSVSLEDVAQIGQANFEAALRSNVSMGLSNAYDNQGINGDGQAPNVNGLVSQLTDPTNPTAVATFAAFLKEAADQIDGLWATELSEVAIVTNADAYKLSAQVFRANSSDLSFSDYARQALGGWWCNKRMPATASTIARGIVYRMGQMGLRTACHPTWGTVAIDDIYTASRSGQRHFTVHVLVGDKVLLVQPDAYGLVEYKVA